MTGPAVHRLDGGVQHRQIEPLDETPHQTHPVIVGQQPIQADRSPDDLIALSKSQPGKSYARALRYQLLGQRCKQSILVTRCHHPTFVSSQTGRF